uniref:Fibrinolytic protein III n=1 Tax=Urechis unicinctus TaxID=6432 RepID=A0A059PJ75_UREUN|nr:fibrinolytic protein III [Urechis unicinctus]
MKTILVAALIFCLAEAGPIADQRPVASFDVDMRIIGGSNAAITTYPYQVSLYFLSSGSHTCGASIISTTKLTCAAHCTQSAASAYGIRAGSASRTSGGQTRSVASRINHSSYCSSCSGIPFDVSTIRLSSALSFSTLVNSITMATSGTFAGSSCMISGWGRTSSSNTLPTTLQAASTTVLSNADCTSRMSNVGGATIRSDHVCVYAGNNGACNGDSGGPLRCGNLLVGSASWVVSSGGNCLIFFPSVYTRISSFASWINNN